MESARSMQGELLFIYQHRHKQRRSQQSCAKSEMMCVCESGRKSRDSFSIEHPISYAESKCESVSSGSCFSNAFD